MSPQDPFPLRLSGPGGGGGAASDCPADICDALAQDPAALLASGTSVKRSRRTQVARLTSNAGPPLALKRYQSHPLRWRAGLGRARRAAWRLAQLRAAGVPAVQPLAWIEGPAGGFVCMPWLEGWAGADRWFAAAAPAARHRCTRALGDALGRLHAAGFAHRDLKAANLLCREADVALVDVDGARRAPLAGAERRARDLWRLWRSLADQLPARTDCRRFLAAYATVLGAPAADRVQRALAVVAVA